MMKRLIAWVLTLALLLSVMPQLSLGVTAEGAAPEAHSHSAAQHDCEHCDETITWTAWEKTNELPKTTGHFYLAADVNVSATTRVEADQDVVICLNGWNISGGYNPENVSASKSFSIYDVRGKLTISDCTAYTDAEGVLHAGKIQKGYRTDSGGTAFWCRYTTSVLTLHDVIVADHYSPFTTSAWGGGAIYLRDGARAELNNSVFTGCKTDAEGGVVMTRGSTLIAKGCTFENNTAKQGGSAIYSPSASTITLHDCTIIGNNIAGKESVHRGAVYSASAGDKLTISGKTVIDGNYVAMDGTPVESNVYLQRELTTPVEVGGLTDGAKISIRTYFAAPATPTFVKHTTAPADWYNGYVLYENNGMALAYNSTDGFHFVVNEIHTHCECGDSGCTETGHKEVEYKPWNEKTTLPTSGNYYLNTDVTLAAETSVSAELNLCLNGHTVTAAKDKRHISNPTNAAAVITISDCTATTEDGVYKAGTLTGGVDKGNGQGGGSIYIRTGGTLKLYDGIITNSSSITAGGAIAVNGGATFIMAGGEISGNTAINGTALKNGGGLVLRSGCTAQILGGTIKNNTADNGGAIYLEAAGTVISNCTISGNTAVKGAAAYVVQGASATLTDCVISDNKASGEGAAAIYADKVAVTLDGCTITGNQVTTTTQAYSGSAIYSPGSSTITLKDCTITDNTFAGTASGIRGAVYTAGKGDKLILSGASVIKNNFAAVDGTAVERNIYLYRQPNAAIDVGGLSDGAELTIFTHWGTETTPTMVKADKAPTAWVRGWVIYDNNSMAVNYDAADNIFFFTLNADHVHCECGATDCTDSTHEQIGYKEWTNETALPTAGNYYLNTDVNLAGETTLTGDLHLCLHGRTVTAAKNQQIITTPNNTDLMLTITDCTAAYENGAYKAGKLTGGVELASKGRGGGAIYIRAEGNMKLYDGIITGNTSGTGGGAIRLGKNATFVMYDGEISDNTAINGTTKKTGGAISALTGTEITILGGTFKNNTGGNGGAIYTEGTLTIRGGIFQNNNGTYGGAVDVKGGAQLNLLGGEFTGNTASVSGGAIRVLDGGKITVGGNPVVKGNTKNGAANNLQLQGTVVMTLDQVGEKAFLGISAEKAFRAISTKTDTDLTSQFVSDRANLTVIYQDSALYLGAADGHKHCLCAGLNAAGCDHQGVAFAAWEETTSLPTSGNWYLTADIDLANGIVLRTEELNLCLNGYDINLAKCAEGRLVYLRDTGKLTITDCTEEPGVISGAPKSAVQFENKAASTPVLNIYNGVFTNNTGMYGGGAVLVQGSGTLNIYGGKLTGNYIKAVAKVDADGNPIVNSNNVQQVDSYLGGGAICVFGTNATTNIYGGVISDNWTEECQRLNAAGNLETIGGTGGAIYTESDLNIYGGEITGNCALNGGGVCTATYANVTMTGGTISGNVARGSGGGINALRGEIVLSGGVITDNIAKSGGGLYVKGCVLRLEGTDVTGNNGSVYAGGIYVAQDIWKGAQNPNKVTFTAGSVSGNSSNLAGGILLEGAYSEMVMTGGEVSGNTSTGTGGGMYVSTNCTFTMEGGKIVNNKAKTGGGMRLFKCTANLKGGEITGNKATSNCGGIYASKQETTLNLQGATVSKNTAKDAAGGVLVEDRATMNFSAGKVTGNTANNGGGIYVSTNSKLNMTGGSITGNSAKAGGGIYCYRGQLLNLAGGSISYNTTKAGGAGMQASGGTIYLKGVSITHNTTEGYGGGFRATGATSKKNGQSIVYPSHTYMYGGVIANNKANGGAGALLEQAGSTWDMYGGTIRDNEATNNGGAMYVSRKTELRVHGGKILNNKSVSSGGAFYHLESKGIYKNCEISGNDGRNGAITSGKKCSVELENVTATGNTAMRYGAVLYTETTGTAIVKNCTFTQNTTGIFGGALFSNTGATMTVTDCVFTENHSEKRGGAIGIYDNAPIVGCVFTGNSAINGGAIYSGDESQRIACNGWGDVMSKAGMQVIDCEFKDNIASDNGGAMYVYMSCYVDVTNSTFTGNQAANLGSAIWSAENLTMENLIITGNTSTNNGHAVFLADAEYDGHSYIRGTMKMGGDMLITDNSGGDLYLDRTTTLAVSSLGLGKNTKIGVTLDSGLLTQRVFGSYDYEGGDCVYTVTYGDRSLTDPEYDPSMVVKAEAETDVAQPDKTQTADTWLYVGIGIFAVAIIALVAWLLMKKKKSAGAETK